MAESLSSAAGDAKGEAASRLAALTKSRRFIGFSIARGGGIRLRLVPGGTGFSLSIRANLGRCWQAKVRVILSAGRLVHEVRRDGVGGVRGGPWAGQGLRRRPGDESAGGVSEAVQLKARVRQASWPVPLTRSLSSCGTSPAGRRGEDRRHWGTLARWCAGFPAWIDWRR